MKNLFSYFLSLLLVGGIFSCKDEDADPVLKLDSPAVITSPASGTAFVLDKATENDVLTTFTWSAATFNVTSLVPTSYKLQMDFAGNNFASPATLATTEDLSVDLTGKTLNDKLLLAGKEPGVATDVEFRLVTNKNGKLDDIYSSIVTLSLTPYTNEVNVKPIYLLGSGTLAGWDNAAALPMTYVEGGKYEIVTTLTAGADQFFKAISTLGAWAPQWGTDATGTGEGGVLVYRPTEAEPDPPAIPTPALTSQYKITLDTALLTYTVVEFGEVWLLGDATLAGWDNTKALPFIKVEEGVYTITTTLGAGAWKIIDERGAWAPQWGTDAAGTADGGALVLRPTENEPDPSAIPAPATAGLYKIEINTNTLTYTVTAQ